MNPSSMLLTVALDARYSVAPDGSVWSQFGMAQHFWERYLTVFDSVKIVARGCRVNQVPEGWLPVTAKNIRLHAVPDFHGPWQYLRRYPEVQAAVRAAVPAHGAVILRVGSQVANILEKYLSQKDRPYAVEVVGDPFEVFGPGVVDHPLRPFFRWHFSRSLRRQCRHAVGVAYVTKQKLQTRYPARSMAVNISDVDQPTAALLDDVVWTHYSNVELDAAGIAPGFRRVRRPGQPQIVTVGSLAQLYKGTDVLIEAVCSCVRAGLDLTAVIVGDGKYRPHLMAQAERTGMASRIRFTGQVTSGEPVRRILDESDLFVLPSRTEGLPRALVEAMARGLPCIGAAVGGIPELLGADELVPPGNATALAAKIQEVLKDPARMEALSRRNLALAREFLDSVLAARRRTFYEHLRDCTMRWESNQQGIGCERCTS